MQLETASVRGGQTLHKCANFLGTAQVNDRNLWPDSQAYSLDTRAVDPIEVPHELQEGQELLVQLFAAANRKIGPGATQQTLSMRLARVAAHVPAGARLADIGSDHGYLSLAAIEPVDGITAISLCGMGGETIRDILDSGQARLRGRQWPAGCGESTRRPFRGRFCGYSFQCPN